ncbi:MAG: HEAT repeat domain-containing protein [Candidatus Marinimicrobia bacterium]|nr:HEAT repeat domain-containing protein [Candidatus Neomarinimicrobiota bacterium]MBL7022561.1 HEAT repeat domain-containing protein [Candidatus Neomarinimicrobiota bacterium]MBL7108917.1 HEAT repeat domain-containing protein [Candidatus Neomarinimicrobiota bacterium]
MNTKTLISSFLTLMFFFGCAPHQTTLTLEEVEKHRLTYYDKGKVKSLSVLIDVYRDTSQPFDVRISALEAISETKHPLALEAIRESVATTNLLELELMTKAVDLLAKYDSSESVESLITGLKTTEVKILTIRETIINAIGEIGSEDEIMTLIDLYEISRSNHARMDKLLTQTLGTIGDERVIPVLIEIANNSDIDIAIRNQAIEILGKKNAPEVVDFFLNVLGDPKSNINLKDFAYNAMGDISEERMILALVESYQSGKKEYFKLLNTLLLAMDEFEHPTLKPALLEIAKSNEFPKSLRLKAIRNLSKFNDTTVLDDLVSMLEYPENYIFYDEILTIVNNLNEFEEYKDKLRMASYIAIQKTKTNNEVNGQ